MMWYYVNVHFQGQMVNNEMHAKIMLMIWLERGPRYTGA